MKLIWLCVIALLTSQPAWASEIGLELLPHSRPFRLTFADPREIKMSLDFEGDSRINAAIGNYFSLFGIRPVNGGNWDAHFGLEGAGYFTMHKANDRFPLESADGLIGAYLEGHVDFWQWQLRLTHTSAHLADGTPPRDAQTPYSREALTLRQAITPINDVQIYGGLTYLVNRYPELGQWLAQTGTNAFLSIKSFILAPFIGADVKWKQDTEHNPSFSLQLGLALNNPPEAYRSFRFFYHYYTGADPRGQFYNELMTAHSIGVEMQI